MKPTSCLELHRLQKKNHSSSIYKFSINACGDRTKIQTNNKHCDAMFVVVEIFNHGKRYL